MIWTRGRVRVDVERGTSALFRAKRYLHESWAQAPITVKDVMTLERTGRNYSPFLSVIYAFNPYRDHLVFW